MPTFTAFASGANEPSEIMGFRMAGLPIGASASLLRPVAIQALSNSSGPVFLDSGAFSEVSYSPEYNKLQVVSPISPKEWRRRLAIYLLLAQSLGDRLTVVAPDRVGDQEETLRRLALYRDELAELAAQGVTILIPLQVGNRTHEEFFVEATEAAGVYLTPAFTMKKSATSLSAATQFLAAVQPSRIHLLGMGPTNVRADEFLDMIRRVSPDTSITMDSNRLRSVTGKKRPLTIAEYGLRSSVPEDCWGDVRSPILTATGCVLDYTDSIASPSLWATQQMLGEVAIAAGFSLSEIHSFLGDPDGFLARTVPSTDIAYYENPLVSMALDQVWLKSVKSVLTTLVRSAAIVRTFQTETPSVTNS
jgi:hypothetical protein